MDAETQAAAFGRAEAASYEVEEETHEELNSFGKDAFDVLAPIGAVVGAAKLQNKLNNAGKSKGS